MMVCGVGILIEFLNLQSKNCYCNPELIILRLNTGNIDSIISSISKFNSALSRKFKKQS